MTGVLDPLRGFTGFTYGSLGTLTSVTDARGNDTGYQYDGAGNLTKITYEDGTYEDYTYDSAGNVLTWTNRRGQEVTYIYNAAGQVLTKDYDTTPGVTDYTYSYDSQGNLLSAADSTGTTTYAYDPVTNDFDPDRLPPKASGSFWNTTRQADAPSGPTRRAVSRTPSTTCSAVWTT